MFFLQYECVPLPGSDSAEDFAGAYVNCWLARPTIAAASKRARVAIRDAGLEIVRLEMVFPISREDYRIDRDGLEYFRQAEKDGECYVIHAFPIGEARDDSSTDFAEPGRN